MTPKASIFAGVNGAGKTTAYFELVSKSIDLGRRINVDEIAWSIGDHPATQVRASRIALTLRKMYLKDKSDFNLETTLCGSGILRLFDELKENGFFICL
ncbi:MAG: ATPase, partial [Campylobacter sp.]|nr:ATPase [Campylobacter sp.]